MSQDNLNPLFRPPVCMKCAHQTIHFDSPEPQCRHPKVADFDVVYGEVPKDCRRTRMEGGCCGPQGTLFEPVNLNRGWLG